MKKTLDNTGLSSYQIVLTQIYILSCGFPHLIKLPVTEYKLQLSELFFFFLLITVIRQKQFFSFWRKQLFILSRGLSIPLLLILYCFVVYVSGLFHLSKSTLLEMSGLAYLLSVFLVLAYVFHHLKNAERDYKDLILKTGLLISIVGLFGWVLHIGGIENPTGRVWEYPYFGDVFRLKGFTATPSFLVNIVGFCLLQAFIPIATTQNKKRYFFFTLALCFTLFLTLTKSVLAVITAACFYFFIQKNKIKPGMRRLIAAIGLLSFFVLQTGTHFLFRNCEKDSHAIENRKDIFRGKGEELYKIKEYCVFETIYALTKQSSTIAGLRYPFTGVGPGSHFNFVSELQKESDKSEKFDFEGADPHCTYLGALAETGFPGFLVLILLFIFLLIESAKLKPEFLSVSVFFVIEAINTDIMNFRHLWIFFAIIFALNLKKTAKL